MASYYMAAFLAFLSIAVPGILLALPFAKRARIPLPLAFGFGAAAGMVLVPLLGFAESLAGIPFSSTLAILNVSALSVAGAFLCIREKAFSGFGQVSDARAFLIANWHWLALLLLMLFAFWFRSLGSEPYAYEVDPYFYLRATQFIVQEGAVPATDYLAWHPYPYTHRERPLTIYLAAGWYLLASPAEFSPEALYTASAPYPPLAAALTAFMIFALAYLVWGERWALLAAALFIFMPVTALKFGAGVVEQQPWGIFALMFFCAAYLLFLKNGGRLLAALAGLAMLGAVLGSKQDVFAIFVFAAFLSLQSLRGFLSGKLEKGFVLENAIVAAGGVLGVLLMLPYRAQGFASAGALIAVCCFSAALLVIMGLEANQGRRVQYLAALAAIAALALVITPLGPLLMQYANTYVLGQATGLLAAIPVQEQLLRNDISLQLGPIGGSGLPMLALLASAFVLMMAVTSRDARPHLLALVLIPLALLGYSQGKFLLHLATILPIALAALGGELESYVRPPARVAEEKPALSFSIDLESGEATTKPGEAQPHARYLPLAIIAIAAMAVLAQAMPMLGAASAALGGVDCKKLSADTASQLMCFKIPQNWADAMAWLASRGGNSSALAWWDYGHWVNYLGQSPTLTRGDLAFPDMIADTAVIYSMGTPQDLAAYMREKGMRYVIFDFDLFSKWDAISHVACYRTNATRAGFNSGKPSACEQELQFEYIFVPLEGAAEGDLCDLNGTAALRVRSSFNRTYCVMSPRPGAGAAALPVFFENGTQLNAGQQFMTQGLVGGRNSAVMLLTYNESSWEHRPGKAYDSPFYSGFVLRKIPGLRQVYPEPGQPSSIVILELANAT